MNENKEQNVENNNVSKEVVKRKTNWGFTLFACIATGVIVFLAMNLGEKAGKIIDPDTNGSSSNVTSNESNSNSNIDSNSNSNVDSNISNVASNPTSNSTVTIASLAGEYKGSLSTNDGEEALYGLTIKADSSCSYKRGVTNGGVDFYNGSCTLNGNIITLKCTEREGTVGPEAYNETFTFTVNGDNTINYNETSGLGNVTLTK